MTVWPWWWAAQAGAVVLGLRYDSKPIEIEKGKNAIEIGSLDCLVDTLLAVREAIVAGELGGQIEAGQRSCACVLQEEVRGPVNT